MTDNQVIHADCLDIMRDLPDNYADLILTDPPYGIFKSNHQIHGFVKRFNSKEADQWDCRIEKKYFDEMKRVSKLQIIWGGNYYAEYLGNFKAPILWNKVTNNNFFADGELAWTNLKGTLRIFEHQWCGAFKASERNTSFLHPTQKPIELFSYCIKLSKLKEGSIVLDPFAGVATTSIACIRMGMKYVCIEKEKKYYDLILKRIDQHHDGNLVDWYEEASK